jgi:hypothetical protein
VGTDLLHMVQQAYAYGHRQYFVILSWDPVYLRCLFMRIYAQAPGQSHIGDAKHVTYGTVAELASQVVQVT